MEVGLRVGDGAAALRHAVASTWQAPSTRWQFLQHIASVRGNTRYGTMCAANRRDVLVVVHSITDVLLVVILMFRVSLALCSRR